MPKKKSIKEKKFVLKCCPACASRNVSVVLGKVGMWGCHKCGWKGTDVEEKDVSEDEFLKSLDEGEGK